MLFGSSIINRLVTITILCAVAVSIPSVASPLGHKGVVVAVNGEVFIYDSEGYRRASEGYAVHPGDTVVAKIGSKCRGITPYGSHFELKGPGRIIFTPPSEKDVIDKIKEFILLQVSQLTGMRRNKAPISRGILDFKYSSELSAPILPANGGLARASSQTFIWKTMEGIDSYVVSIAPEDGDETTYNIRGHTMTREDLEPGKGYIWKVVPNVKGLRGGSHWHSFFVMQSDEEKLLDASLSALPELEGGVLLLSTGLYGEAILRFDNAINTGENARSAMLWRSRAMAAIGLFEEAYKNLNTLMENK